MFNSEWTRNIFESSEINSIKHLLPRILMARKLDRVHFSYIFFVRMELSLFYFYQCHDKIEHFPKDYIFTLLAIYFNNNQIIIWKNFEETDWIDFDYFGGKTTNQSDKSFLMLSRSCIKLPSYSDQMWSIFGFILGDHICTYQSRRIRAQSLPQKLM